MRKHYGGAVTEGQFLNLTEVWLGEGYSADQFGRYISMDGLRVVRYGPHETGNPNNHHGHFEVYDSEGRFIIENTVVEIIPQ